MAYKLLISPEAQEDIEFAAFWYELHKNGLGSEFILSIDAEINLISRNPLVYPKIYKHVRRAVINRFPYAIFYIVNNKIINILALIHQSRNPKIFKKKGAKS